MGIDVLDQAVRILAHFEEICLFLGLGDRTSAVRTFAVVKLGLRPEGFAGSAVPSLIGSLVDITLIVELFEDLLDLFLVRRIAGADKAVVAGVHQIPDPLDLSGIHVDKRLRSHSCFRGLVLVLLAVLVRSCLEHHVIAFDSLVARDRVRENRFICVADVRLA